MRLFVISILVIFSGTLSFHQTDYHFIIERASVTFFNKTYVDNAKIIQYFFNRHSKRYNLSFDFVQDVDTHFLTFFLEGRKFQSNEYRLFPFNYSENVCNSIRFPKFGNTTMDNFETNFITTKCVVKRGQYYAKGIHYDDSTFPPYAPRGRYLLIAYFMYKKTILLANTETHIEIKPQNPLERVVGV